MAHGRNAERQSLIFPRGSLLTVASEVHCLNVLWMVVSPRPSHSSRINVIGHDVAIVRERHLTMAHCLLCSAILRLSNFRISAFFLDQLTATAGEGSVNRTVLIATEFHGIPHPFFLENGLGAPSGLVGFSAGWDFGQMRNGTSEPVSARADPLTAPVPGSGSSW